MTTDSLRERHSRPWKTSLPRIAVFASVFFSIFLAFYVFDIQNEERINHQNARYAEDSAFQAAERVAGELNNAKNLIISYTHFLERLIRQPSVEPAQLEELDTISPFDSINFTNAQGVNISVGGRRSDVRELDIYKKGMEDESGVSLLDSFGPFEQPIFSFYAPLHHEGKVFGVLDGSFLAGKYMRDILAVSYFGQDADVYLCSADGGVIASAARDKINGPLLPALLSAGIIDEKTARAAEKALKDNRGGSFIASPPSRADNLCVVYVPGYDYALVQIFPPGVTEAMLREANKSGIELEIFLIAVFSAFSLWLIWSGAAARKKLQRENQEISEVLYGLDTLFDSRYCRIDLESGEYSYVAGAPRGDNAKTRGAFAELLYSYSNECASEREQAEFRVFFALDNIIAQLSGRNFFTYELHVIRKEGEGWENLTAICLDRRNGQARKVLFLRQDVTELKQREYAAQKKIASMDRRERQYQLAITSSAICAFEFNVTKDLVSQTLFREKNGQKISMLARLGLNAPCRASEIFYGWTKEVLPDSRAEYDRIMNVPYLLASFNAGDAAVELDYWIKDSLGQEICVRHSFYLTRDKLSGDVMALSVIKDITGQVIRQKEQTRSLKEALMQARHANRAKTVFLSNMSHDIRTPMNAIIGFSTIAARHINNKELVADALGKVLSSSNHLLNLINDILDMSSIESGKMQLKEKECNISEIIHNLLNIIQPQVKTKQLQLFIDTSGVAHEDIIIDPLKLNQVLINLLGNAIKYTPATGSVTLRILQKPAFKHGWAEYVFIVADTGMGMSRDFISHIFEPFTRESTTTISGIQGTGLGMAITKNIVDMMGGSIEVESAPGKGSRFTIKIEARICERQRTSACLPEFTDMHVLVVDDDFNVCDSVDKMLRKIGMRPEWASNGYEAVHRAKIAMRNGEPFSVFIIDWQMPEMDGVETARTLRRTVGENIPIIVLTAYDWSEIKDEALSAGVTAFCAKPLFMSDLANALQTALSEKNTQENEPGWQPPNYEGRRILLVDDVEMNREIAEFMLRESGFLVDSVPDGTDAVEMVRKSPDNFYDAILMDVQMPIMDGYEATRIIRGMEREDARSMPIIAMTANALEEDRAEALKNGMNDHLAKPLDIWRFFEVLEKYMAPGKNESQPS